MENLKNKFYWQAAKVTLNEYEFSWNKLANIQPQLEEVISRNYYLNKSAREAYKWATTNAVAWGKAAIFSFGQKRIGIVKIIEIRDYF